MHLIRAAGFAGMAEPVPSDWDAVVLDGYHFPDEEMAEGWKRIWVDDFGNRLSYEAHAVVNFTVSASSLSYPVKHRFLGVDFFPARRGLQRLRKAENCGRRVLVAIGGFDRANLANRICRVVPEDHEVVVAVGSRFAWAEELNAFAGESEGRVRVLGFQKDNAEIYRDIALCLCGGGLTKYEAAYLGLPAGVVSQTPEQQRETEAFCAAGLCADLGFGEALDDGELGQQVATFMNSTDLHDGLRARSLAAFPADAPQRFARGLLASLS
jgi:spore coat polysaccharide biosynthesis predicted glycosyltransferase SpsG